MCAVKGLIWWTQPNLTEDEHRIVLMLHSSDALALDPRMAGEVFNKKVIKGYFVPVIPLWPSGEVVQEAMGRQQDQVQDCSRQEVPKPSPYHSLYHSNTWQSLQKYQSIPVF